MGSFNCIWQVFRSIESKGFLIISSINWNFPFEIRRKPSKSEFRRSTAKRRMSKKLSWWRENCGFPRTIWNVFSDRYSVGKFKTGCVVKTSLLFFGKKLRSHVSHKWNVRSDTCQVQVTYKNVKAFVLEKFRILSYRWYEKWINSWGIQIWIWIHQFRLGIFSTKPIEFHRNCTPMKLNVTKWCR